MALDDPRALDVAVVGAKAANLARAASARLAVLPGFAVTVDAVAAASAAGGFSNLADDAKDALHAAWRAVSGDGTRSVVTRSSATSEDAEGSSMAGRFTSVLDVWGWRGFVGALDEVAESARVIALDGSGSVEDHTMAILVQPFLPAAMGGVLFGADPVSGRLDRLALATVRGGPDALVSGEDGGSSQVLSRHGRVLTTEGDPTVAPDRSTRHALAAMARRAATVFGGPQDVEWAVDADGRLWLLQARPVTTLGTGVASGPVLGPGPVAETFPDPLTRLEQDLWLDPLRAGMAHALDLTGVVPRRRLASSPVALAVGGRAAVDLELIGAIPKPSSLWRKLDPRPGARRLRAAWRTGRLRNAMPSLASALVADVDDQLAAIPPVATLDDADLLGVLYGTRRALVALHGQEVLAGLLLTGGASASAGASGGAAAAALAALAEARRAGVPDERIPARYPVVLALVPPAIRPATLAPCSAALPVTDASPTSHMNAIDVDDVASLREALRLRARWVQEISAIAAWEVAERLASRGVVDDPDTVRHLPLAELEPALTGHGRVGAVREPASAALPAMFRLDALGRPVAVAVGGTRAGQGAGGGRREGVVVHDAAGVVGHEGGTVLVTRTLAPGLASVLPGLSGLVAETGSVLSHLAILARELGVPTVVGVADAMERFAEGARVVVDGATGDVEVVS
ncbi:MAG TPA: PEP/pyruvate-binding domain-containing protein [Acidimicrobiales bacterium]